jgi:hypothetical protein
MTINRISPVFDTESPTFRAANSRLIDQSKTAF